VAVHPPPVAHAGAAAAGIDDRAHAQAAVAADELVVLLSQPPAKSVLSTAGRLIPRRSPMSR